MSETISNLEHLASVIKKLQEFPNVTVSVAIQYHVQLALCRKKR